MSRTKLRDRIMPDYTRGEEIANTVTHIVGGAMGITATVLCVILAALHRNPWAVVSGAVFGATMILLYTMSSIYHGLRPHLFAKRVFQVLDHCTIYLLIAGTYTPFTLCILRPASPALGWTVFGLIWGLAALGVTLTAIDLHRFRHFAMICYLGMGWLCLFTIKPLVLGLGAGGTVLLASGGVAYTLGAVLYLLGHKRRYLHSVFHAFVLLGSLLHFFCILFYVM